MLYRMKFGTSLLLPDMYSVIEELENLGIKNIYTFCTPKHRGSDVENDHFLNGSMVEKKTEVLRLITD